ncbi:hypothetical protein C8Q73DRAFT_714271 [Cubamyces lactineus]|nr:hypothetical protein C8Q73DRAFT_714271 [Cubamyces lactineus]
MHGTAPGSSECTDSSDDLAHLAPSPSPDDDLWFEDGNVIVVAGDTEFRLFKGPLVAHSLVFEEMLSLPHPKLGSAPVDKSSPVICLNESPVKLKFFLRRFSLGRTLSSLHEPSFDEIHACILLASKYKCGEIFTQCLEYLQKFYPSRFEPWDPKLPPPVPSNPPGLLPIHCIGIVNLARSIGEDSLLPMALARCMTIPDSELSAGFVCMNGVREVLSPEDFIRVVIAQRNLVQVDRRIAHKIFMHPDSCEMKTKSCGKTLARLYDVWIAAEATLDPLRLVHEYVALINKQGHSPGALCDVCYSTSIKKSQEGQETLYRDLPTAMGVVVGEWIWEPPKHDSKLFDICL